MRNNIKYSHVIKNRWTKDKTKQFISWFVRSEYANRYEIRVLKHGIRKSSVRLEVLKKSQRARKMNQKDAHVFDCIAAAIDSKIDSIDLDQYYI